MKDEDKKLVESQILKAYPGIDPEMDIEWDMIVKYAIEIAFNAGYGFAIVNTSEAYFNAGQMEGRQEVVEWVEANKMSGMIPVYERPWIAQKKDWGIE